MPNMTQRLLAASELTYEIFDDGQTLNRNRPGGSFAPIGLRANPVGIETGPDGIDGAFVGTMEEGLLVAIRGTTNLGHLLANPAQFFTDWFGDAGIPLVPASTLHADFRGRLHQNFLLSTQRLWTRLRPLVEAAAAAHTGAQRIYVTGHSKGGSVAPLIAALLSKALPHQIVVRAFAPARVGDAEFGAYYDGQVPNHVRFEFNDDPVPHLPLRTALAGVAGLRPDWAELLTTFDPG